MITQYNIWSTEELLLQTSGYLIFFFFFGIIISNTVLWELIGKCKLNYLQRMIAGEWDYEHLDFHRGIYYGTGRKGIYSVELRKGQSKVWCFAKTYDKKLCSVQSLSCRTLCDSLDCSTPGFPVHHHLSELAQSHVHWVGYGIKLSHPLLFLSFPAFNLSQNQSLFQWVSSLHQTHWKKPWCWERSYFVFIFRETPARKQ